MSKTDTTEVGDAIRHRDDAIGLSPMRGKGKEITDYLREALGLPPGVTRFTVTFSRDELIRVHCDYLPRA